MGQVAAILAAAGRGSRFGAAENKVFTRLAGRSLLYWALRALERSPSIDDVVVATGAEDCERVSAAVAEGGFTRVRAVCAGGAERYDTVCRALERLPAGARWVAVHDAARPLARPALIEAVVAAARESGAAVPATPVVDTLKRSADGRVIDGTAERAGLYQVQTPQVFRRDLLVRALALTDDDVTDEAALIERLGVSVATFEGDERAFKVTTPLDFALARTLLSS